MHTEYRYDYAIITDGERPDIRFIVTQDDSANDPITDSGAPVEHYVVASGYFSATDAPTGELSEVFARLHRELDTDAALAALRRYLVAFHGWTAEEAESRAVIHHHRGCAQSDWAHLLVIVTEDGYGDAKGWGEEWSQYARGDVWTVTAETRTPCVSEECHGDDESHWGLTSDQGVDHLSLSGIYADDVEEAARVYIENEAL